MEPNHGASFVPAADPLDIIACRHSLADLLTLRQVFFQLIKLQAIRLLPPADADAKENGADWPRFPVSIKTTDQNLCFIPTV
jgi:hypothetical protein